jgi:sarcosine oxidase, subunit beta
MKPYDLVVIGGGLQGLSTAFWSAREGARVLVLERDRIGRHASGFSAGGVRTLGRALPEVPLALDALDLWTQLDKLTGDDCGFVASGQVKLAETPDDMRILEQRVALLRAHGFEHEVLHDGPSIRALVPGADPSVAGGLVAARDGYAEPYRTTRAFGRAAMEAGADIREGWAVVGADHVKNLWKLRLSDGSDVRTRAVVNAAGAWGRRTARLFGDDFPLGFNALMMMLTEALPPFITQVAGATSRSLSFKQTAQGHVMIGGGPKGIADLDTGRVRLDIGRLAASARTARDLFPAIRHAAIVHAWAGIEAIMPDEIPVIGRSSRAPGLVHLCGFSGHGFELAPLTGRIAADLAAERDMTYPIAAFSPDRFAQLSRSATHAMPQPAG